MTFEIFWDLDAQNKTKLFEEDLISIPTHCFRSFENIGKKYGFLYTIIGGDDTGRVEWASPICKSNKMFWRKRWIAIFYYK